MCSYFNNTNNYLPKSVAHPRRRNRFRYPHNSVLQMVHRIAVQQSNKKKNSNEVKNYKIQHNLIVPGEYSEIDIWEH